MPRLVIILGYVAAYLHFVANAAPFSSQLMETLEDDWQEDSLNQYLGAPTPPPSEAHGVSPTHKTDPDRESETQKHTKPPAQRAHATSTGGSSTTEDGPVSRAHDVSATSKTSPDRESKTQKTSTGGSSTTEEVSRKVHIGLFFLLTCLIHMIIGHKTTSAVAKVNGQTQGWQPSSTPPTQLVTTPLFHSSI